MPHLELSAFAPDRPAATVDAALRQALLACDRAGECAVLWFAEVQHRGLYRELGYACMELYVTEGLGCTRNRYWQFKRLADELERLPLLRDAVSTGQIGWTKARQVARVATAQDRSRRGLIAPSRAVGANWKSPCARRSASGRRR